MLDQQRFRLAWYRTSLFRLAAMLFIAGTTVQAQQIQVSPGNHPEEKNTEIVPDESTVNNRFARLPGCCQA